MGVASQADVVAYLLDPATYGSDVTVVERHETHGSSVFLAGEFAYKLKRAVRFPYLDYSTVALRRQMCEKELAVNRRTAAHLYLAVRPIVADRAAGLRWGRPGEESEAVDWVVVMRRFAQSDLLEEMRKSGRLTPALMRSLAESIAAFHMSAEPSPAGGGAAGLAAVVNENLAILGGMAGRQFRTEDIAELATRSRAELTHVAALLDRRREAGFVRSCHGDLHLNNVCLIDAKPVLFDAIEFNDAFANIDVFYDLAFLLMDLARYGLRGFANTVLNRYLEVTGDHGALPALALFLSCRAAVRAHVTTSASDAVSPARQSEALDLLQTALVSLAPAHPQIIAVGGASGTGKSTLAYALAPALGPSPGAITIRSDIVRKRLLGVSETTRLPESAYTSQISHRVYATMAEMAGDVLRAGRSVVADAVFGEPVHRQRIEAVARTAGHLFTGLWLEGPEEVMFARLAQRHGDASNATAETLIRQLGTIQPPGSWMRLDAGKTPAACLAQAEAILGVGAKSDEARLRP